MELLLPDVVYDLPSKVQVEAEFGENAWLALKLLKRIHLRTLLAERQNHRCCYCGFRTNLAVAKKDKATVEHVLAQTRGGRDEPDHCVMACWRCNNKRRDRVLAEEVMVLEWEASRSSTSPSASPGSSTPRIVCEA